MSGFLIESGNRQLTLMNKRDSVRPDAEPISGSAMTEAEHVANLLRSSSRHVAMSITTEKRDRFFQSIRALKSPSRRSAVSGLLPVDAQSGSNVAMLAG